MTHPNPPPVTAHLFLRQGQMGLSLQSFQAAQTLIVDWINKRVWWGEAGGFAGEAVFKGLVPAVIEGTQQTGGEWRAFIISNNLKDGENQSSFYAGAAPVSPLHRERWDSDLKNLAQPASWGQPSTTTISRTGTVISGTSASNQKIIIYVLGIMVRETSTGPDGSYSIDIGSEQGINHGLTYWLNYYGITIEQVSFYATFLGDSSYQLNPSSAGITGTGFAINGEPPPPPPEGSVCILDVGHFGYGFVSPWENSVKEFPKGTTLTFTAAPVEGLSSFDHWELKYAGQTETGTDASFTFTCKGYSTTLKAFFTSLGPAVAVEVLTTEGGSTIPEPGFHDYPLNSTQQFRALPNPGGGYVFDHWQLPAQETRTENPLDLTLTHDTYLKAIFTKGTDGGHQCPNGYHWDEAKGQCVEDTVTPPTNGGEDNAWTALAIAFLAALLLLIR